MPRLALALLLVGLLARAQDAVERHELRPELEVGQRFGGSNLISYEITTTVRQGQKETKSVEAVKRTERFVDTVKRAGLNGVLEIERSYLKLFSTVHDDSSGTKTVYRSPLQGQRVVLRERNRRREIKLEPGTSTDPLVRRTAGLEIDWRDVFSDQPVGPGDAWNGDAVALARRLAAYLNCGSRTTMRIRYEETVEREGVPHAKLYVDWTLEGMRDRNLFTKVVLAGDLFYDLQLQRVVEVDLTGTMVVRGAIIGQGPPRIVKGEGPVVLKSTLKPVPVEAAAPGEDEAYDDDEG